MFISKWRIVILAVVLVLTILSFKMYDRQRLEKVYDVAEAPAGVQVKRGVKPEADVEAVVLEVESAGFSYGRIVIEP